jgi:hypothetical protein
LTRSRKRAATDPERLAQFLALDLAEQHDLARSVAVAEMNEAELEQFFIRD